MDRTFRHTAIVAVLAGVLGLAWACEAEAAPGPGKSIKPIPAWPIGPGKSIKPIPAWPIGPGKSIKPIPAWPIGPGGIGKPGKPGKKPWPTWPGIIGKLGKHGWPGKHHGHHGHHRPHFYVPRPHYVYPSPPVVYTQPPVQYVAPTYSYPAPAPSYPVQYSDGAIHAAVANLLASHFPGQVYKLKIEVKGGEVEIDGKVFSPYVKAAIEQAIYGIPGVRKVDNDLHVKH